MRPTQEDKVLSILLFEPERAASFLTKEAEGGADSKGTPDWKKLSEKALEEGVSAVLSHNIRKQGIEELIPADTRRELSDRYLANLKRNLSIIGALRTILADFEKSGIPCMVLKGIALAEHIYPDIALRGMSDVDIMVKKEDLFRVDELLSLRGYTPADSTVSRAVNNPAGYLASLDYRSIEPSPLTLHVHWHPVNSSVPAAVFAERIDVSRLWENASDVSVAESRVRMLKPEHLIIYLCEHALRIGHSFDRLILVCDIVHTLRTFEGVIDWDFLVKESRLFNLSRLVYHGLSIVRHHAPQVVPAPRIEELRPPDLTRGEKYFLRLQFGNRRIRGSSYFIYLAMNRGVVSKTRFILRTFFPPAHILLQRQYRKEAEPSAYLYMLRTREIISHIFRLTGPRRGKTPEET